VDFKKFADLIRFRFDQMAKESVLYRADVDRDTIWNLYPSFPEGTNPIYRERTEHDCNTCKNFIRDVGDVVVIKNGKLSSVWDIEIEGPYGEVVNVLSEFVRKQKIQNIFQHFTKSAGAQTTRQLLENGSYKTWNHFSCSIPQKFVGTDGEKLNVARTNVQVFERGLKEISDDSISTVLELIEQGSLYRGEEHKPSIVAFKKLKTAYDKITDETEKSIFLWENNAEHGARIKNTVIGTLLVDLSSGEELDKSVRSFETKVAPANYKRPTALVTKGMIEQAMKTIEDLGIEPALYRRFAVPEDLSVNNVLFVDRSTASKMKGSLKDNLLKEVKPKKDFSKVEEVSIEDFTKKILPGISGMEVLFKNKHTSNLMSIIAPVHEDAPNILKWMNNFTWSYTGNVADSIKERVKKAGGKVDGIMRVSLSWSNYDDLDIHVIEPGGFEIYYGDTYSKTSGNLDVDMNAGRGTTRDPVENIVWTDARKITKGIYKVRVHNFTLRETTNIGFEIQTEFNGEITNYSYPRKVNDKQFIDVLTFRWDGEKVVDIVIAKDIELSTASKIVWNIPTETFHKVNILTISPNHWDDQAIGNKHFFFILENCLNDEQPGGFYNEYLRGDLDKHRKVFEMISGKMKCEPSDRQLSGLGFSSTKHDELICRISGNFDRELKIKF